MNVFIACCFDNYKVKVEFTAILSIHITHCIGDCNCVPLVLQCIEEEEENMSCCFL